MKIIRLHLFILLSFLLSLFTSPAFAVDNSRQKTSLSLQKTAEYVKSWSSRASFPDSVTLAYYYTYAMIAMGETIVPEQKTTIVDFIQRCQKENGGFAAEPSHSKLPNVIFTCYALKSLTLLNAMETIDRQRAMKFLSGLVQENGGIAAQYREKEQPNLTSTYYGLESLNILGALERIDKAKAVTFLGEYRVQGRGFSMFPKVPAATPQATYMALASLDILGSLSEKDQKDSISFLLKTRYAGMADEKKYSTLPQLRQMAFTIQTLSRFSALNQANTMKMYEFIASLYIPENGGFGPEPGLGTTPPSTFDAVLCLVKLDRQKLHDPEGEEAE